MGDRRSFIPFDPKSTEPFNISRTKIELFIRCLRCFYLNQRHGVSIPGGAPFGLNIRIDGLLKKDADRLRLSQMEIPRARRFGIHARPFSHPKIKQWLDVFNNTGLQYLHPETNLLVFGAPDDIWLVNNTALSVVDVKATHSNKLIEQSYFWEENKRQVELYSWLLSKQVLIIPVSTTCFFIRINTNKSQDSFDKNCLDFEDEVFEHHGSYNWIEPALTAIKACLTQDKLPESGKNCSWCKYRSAAAVLETQTPTEV